MKLTHFFVNRPIFAAVLSAMLLIVGAISLTQLPLSEYPAVTPPTVQVRAAYPGANPKVISETVAAPLEQEINGIEGMLYMASQSTTDGRMTLTVTFEQGVDAERAQVQVQNRVQRALPRLPLETQRIGVVTEKTSPDMLMVAHLVSPGGERDALFLTNYALLNIRDELQRVPGVGSVFVWGAGEYSMRIWIDPEKLAARGLTASDVVAAIREQNVQVAAGALGQQPDASTAFQIPITTRGRLADESEFADIIVKTGAAGEITRLGDVARIELGANGYALRSMLDGKPAAGIQIIQAPGANALDVAAAVRAKLSELSDAFPSGVAHQIAYDPTLFVRASIRNVIGTLVEAVLLVVLVVVLFLQSWRASIIPLAAVPVSLVGTAAVMHLLGYSLNTLSLFGLVLSIGIVVDDAIVVVENVERHLANGLAPKEAARRAMTEVTGPIIAITSVLAAVFIPTAFLGGLTGQFYKQFAITIAISTILSAINSLTLSPALAGVLLRPHDGKRDLVTRVLDTLLGRWLFRPFNRLFDRASEGYVRAAKRVLRVSGLALLVYGGLLVLTWTGFSKVPTGFVPMQDKYYLVGIAQLPPGASLDRTEAVVKKMSDIALAEPGVANVVALPGLSINGFSLVPNAAVVFTMLDPFEQRETAELSANAIAGRINAKLSTIQDGFVAMFPPPPVPGLGNRAGFKLQLEDRAGLGHEALHAATMELVKRASADPELAGLMASFEINAPQLALDVDRVKAKQQGVPLAGVFETLQISLGSLYVNDFNRAGRTYQVNVQADAPYRMQAEDIGRLQVRNLAGDMVPLAALIHVEPTFGPDRVTRYNGYPSSDITGAPAPGASTGEAVAAMERLAAETLPPGITYEWTELTLQEKLAGDTGTLVFPIAILLAFLILAAQYNSWSLPFAVLLTVPLSLLSAIAGVWLTGGDNNIFTQIGFVVLVGLSAKNSILIVEFARAKEDEGVDPVKAALEACRLRLRPILMTSIAFIMGVVPLAIATGAGAEMRQAMGIAVLAGMLGVTLFGLLLTPVFYVLIRRASIRRVPRALVIVASLVLAAAPAHAETRDAPRNETRLSLAEAIAIAVANNTELAAAGYTPRRAAAEVESQRGVFDPVLSIFGGIGRDKTPQASPTLGTFRDTLTAEASLSGRLPIGTVYELSYGTTRLDSDTQLAATNPASSAYVQLDVRQPLLRGFGTDVNKAGIALARGAERIADAGLRRQTELTVATTVAAYWRLVRAHRSLAVARESQKLAQQLVERTQARVAAGDLPTIELTQARASVAAREEAVILGEAEVGNANDALARLLVVDPARVFGVAFVPTDEPLADTAGGDEAALVDAALRQRAELHAARETVGNAEIALAAARNLRRPDLSAVASVGVGGLDRRWTSANGELARDLGDQHRWSAGLVFSVPLGNRSADGAHEGARLALEQARLAERALQLEVTEDVRAARRNLEASTKRVEATRRAAELARDQLAAGEKRLATGLSTAFEVLRLQTDLAAAQNAEIAALTAHRVDRMRLELATGALFAAAVERGAAALPPRGGQR